MHTILKSRSVGVKMLISYSILLLLPLCIILLYLFPQMRQHIIDSALMGKQNNVARLSATLDLHVSEMISSAVELGHNAKLTPYALQRSAGSEYEALQLLQKGKSPSTIVTDFFYYVKDSNRFLTSRGGVYPLSWVTDTAYGYCYINWDEQSMYRDLQALNAIRVRPMEKVKYPTNLESAVITVMLPIPTTSTKPYAVLLMWVDQKALTQLISPVQADSNESTFLFDHTGQCILAQHGANISPDVESVSAALSSIPLQDVGILEINAEEYVYASAGAGSTFWRCVSLTPMASLTNDIAAVQRNIYAILALLMIAGISVFMLALRTQYLPIRSLADKAERYSESAGSKNEFEVVRLALEHLQQQTENLKSRVSDSLPELRRNKLLALIGGHYESISAFNASSKEVDLCLSLPHLCVSVLSIAQKDPFETQDIIDGFLQSPPCGLEGYCTPALNGRDLLVISAGQSDQSIHVFLTDICADIRSTQKCTVRAAIGSDVLDASKLCTSYCEAMATQDRMCVLNQTGVQSAASASPDCIVATTEMLYQIGYAVEKKDIPQIEAFVSGLIQYMKSSVLPAQIIHTVYKNTITLLLHGLDTHGGNPAPYEQLKSPALSVQFDELELNLKNACAVLVEQLYREAQGKPEVDIEQVKAFIRENCLQYEFTIQTAADEFGMSYSSFCHFFKRKTDMSCKQFIDDYRTEQAVFRIMHTLKPLDVIAQEVGFSNASAFIRFFKKSTGKTPGSYRNL